MATLPDDEDLGCTDDMPKAVHPAQGGWWDRDPSLPEGETDVRANPDVLCSADFEAAFALAFDEVFPEQILQDLDLEPGEAEPTQWLLGRLVHLN